MKVRFKQRWSSISVLMMLSMVLAACGGDATTPSASGSAGGGASSSPAASASTGGSASASASTSGASASASTGGSASASASTGGTSASPSASAGGEETATAGAGAGSGAAASCPTSVQGTQITMWSPLTGGDGDELDRIAQQYSQENANGIQVQHVKQPEYAQRLNTAAAGNTLPDMLVVRATDIPEFAERNIIKPMPAEALTIVGGEGIASDFPEEIWAAGEYDSNRYAVPLDVQGQVLYYNTEMVEAAGVEIPADRPMTREEFEAAAQALNQNNVMGIAIGTHYSGATWFDTLVRQNGGRLWNEDGTEVAYNSDIGVQALTTLRDLKQQYSPNISGQGDPEVTAFQQGRAAMVIHGPWWISGLQELPFTGFAMVPQIGDEYAVVGGSHQLALTTDDPARQAAAACWIGWLSENSVQWAAAGNIPARTSERESAQIEEISPAVASIAEEAEYLELPPAVPGLATAVGVEGADRAVNAVLLGQQQDVQTALNEAAQRSNQLIQQNAQQYGAQ